MDTNQYGFGGPVLYGSPVDANGGMKLESSFALMPPLPYSSGTSCSVTVVSYDITQLPFGDGVALLFYDATTLPADGTPVFGNADPSQTPIDIVPIVPGGTYRFAPPAGHVYTKGYGVIVNEDTTYATVRRANLMSVLGVHYFPLLVL